MSISIQKLTDYRNLNRLISVAIILAVIGLSAYLGRNPTQNLLMKLVLGVGGIILFVVLTRRPMWGLMLLILVSFFGRWELGTGTNVTLNLTIVLAAFMIVLWLLKMIGLERDIRPAHSRITAPALAFALATTISLVAGNVQWILNAPEGASLGAQLGGWILYVLPMGILLFVGNMIKDLTWLRRITWLFLALGTIYLASRIFPQLTFLRLHLLVPKTGFGSVFWTWFAALSAGQLLFNRELSLRGRSVMLVMLIAAFCSAWFQSKAWVSGWGPALLAVVLILWLYSWRIGLALTLTGLFIGVVLLSTIYVEVFTPVQLYSIFSRAATYPIMFKLVLANPITGLGMANYHHYTVLYPILGWNVQFNSHNNYMDILAQTGLVGLGIFAWLAFELIRLGWRLRARAQGGFSRGFVNAALVGWIATLVSGLLGDWFLPFLYNISTPGFRSSAYAWIFLGGLIALEQIISKEVGIATDDEASQQIASIQNTQTAVLDHFR